MEKPEIKLRQWQKDLLKFIEKGPIKRQILWVWSKESGTGKSTFQDYVFAEYGERVIRGEWTWKDFLHVYNNEDIIIFNIERDTEMHDTHYNVLEKVSDCTIHTATKFEGGKKKVAGVVLVFANIPPPHKRLPKRCIEYHIGDKYEVESILTDFPEGESSSSESDEE